MAMTLCKECGQPISTKAEACPHCGANVLTGRKFLSLIVIVVFAKW